jgi:adenosylcobinamide-phosphate synthase
MSLPTPPELIAATSCAIVLGSLVDRVFGDPPRMPHLVRGIGALIVAAETRLRPAAATPGQQRFRGIALVVAVLGLSGIGALVVVLAAYAVSVWLGLAVEALLCFQCLAVKSLKIESGRVRDELFAGDLAAARADLSMIVGRDTAQLDEAGVARAAVETVAENSSDGVVAPLLAMLVGGGVGGVCYKAINTMDSMIGYRDARYLHFGRAAARLDDAANWLPARVSAVLMVAAAALTGHDWRNAWRIWRRDHANHASPNSAHPEAACAGALRIQLGGPASYAGVRSDKPTLGDPGRPLQADDIARATRLMSVTGWLALLGVVAVRIALGVIVYAAR